ncbi:3'-5' exoribonuclease domain-containing protein [Vibrio parahaemolyticus]|uniref:3'-5' exoribonuclease domain-containing protein n=1 Tax=Vibrio parahaemolyticus TaxID=670 RepID=UPI003D81813A
MIVKKYNAATIDFESLSTDTDCKVLSFGLVPFNRGELATFDELRKRESSLYIKFRLAGQEELGLVEDQGTWEWWEQQGPEARWVLEPSEHDVSVEDAMKRIADHLLNWLEPIDKNGAAIYCRGYDFDGDIIKNLFKVTGVKSPIKRYNRFRCIRTAIDELALQINGYIEDEAQPTNFIPHNSLHDAAFDTSVLVALQARQRELLQGNN